MAVGSRGVRSIDIEGNLHRKWGFCLIISSENGISKRVKNVEHEKCCFRLILSIKSGIFTLKKKGQKCRAGISETLSFQKILLEFGNYFS